MGTVNRNYYIGNDCIINLDMVVCAYEIYRNQKYMVHVLLSGVADDYYLLSGQQATDFWESFKSRAMGRNG